MLTFSLNPCTEMIMNPEFYSMTADNDYARQGLSESYFKKITGNDGYGEGDNLYALGMAIKENEVKNKVKKELSFVTDDELQLGFIGFAEINLVDDNSAYDDTNERLDLKYFIEEFNYLRDVLIIYEGIDLKKLIIKALEGNKKAIHRLKVLIEEQNIGHFVQELLQNPYVNTIISSELTDTIPKSRSFDMKAQCA